MVNGCSIMGGQLLREWNGMQHAKGNEVNEGEGEKEEGEGVCMRE